MNLSKSKYCQAVQCKKMLWLEENMPYEKTKSSSEAVFEQGTRVGEIARDLYSPRVDIPYYDNKSLMIKETNKALEKDNVVITEASFQYDGNFCSVDILIKKDNLYEIIEVKSSTEVHDIYVSDVAYQYYILKSLGFSISKVSILYINASYTRGKKLDLNKLFIFKDVTKDVVNNYNKVFETICSIKEYMSKKTLPLEDEVCLHCFEPYNCLYFDFCTKHLPDKNVFKIRRMSKRKKVELYHNGIITYEKLLNSNINSNYKQQIDFEINNKEPYINSENIKAFLDDLYYPLYFLDFETYQQAIPLYEGIRPYMQIPFQYSLHYIKKDGGKLYHKEFLGEAGTDTRRELAERLVMDIPKNACVLAYNMMFEKMVIKDLAKEFDDLKEPLMNIYNHIKDLMVPFVKRDYYQKEMNGSYSIKYVLPALFMDDPSLNYNNLEGVHNGSEASTMFANLQNYSKEEQDVIRRNLLKYCELDTYAMVKIWQKLNDVVKEKVF